MKDQVDYSALVNVLAEAFGDRLKMIVLFGSQSRGEARPTSDHDVFVVIEELPGDPLARRRAIMAPLLPELLRLPEGLSVIAKTSQEVQGGLTPLVVDVCVDGISLYGHGYFETLRSKVLQAIRDSGLQRRRIAGTWMWMLPTLSLGDWELTWEGSHERI